MNGWVPLTVAAAAADRPVQTIRTWARRRQVRSACRVRDRAIVVWWPDIFDRAEGR